MDDAVGKPPCHGLTGVEIAVRGGLGVHLVQGFAGMGGDDGGGGLPHLDAVFVMGVDFERGAADAAGD